MGVRLSIRLTTMTRLAYFFLIFRGVDYTLRLQKVGNESHGAEDNDKTAGGICK